MRSSSNNNKKNQRGFTMVELIIVLVVGTILVVGAFTVYNKQVKPSMYVNGKMESFANLAASLEQVKMMNANSYPQGTVNNLFISTATTNLEKMLMTTIGQSNNTYSGWKYDCPANGSLKITVSVADTTDNILRDTVRLAIVNNYKDWTCDATVATDGTFSCTKAGTTCQ